MQEELEGNERVADSRSVARSLLAGTVRAGTPPPVGTTIRLVPPARSYLAPRGHRARPRNSIVSTAAHPSFRAKIADVAGGEVPKRILICDEERHIVRLLQANLQRQGYEVFAAFTERAALDSFASSKPDLVILDAVMPGFDGFSVLKAIRSDPENEGVYVIMIIEEGNDEMAYRVYHEGADMHFVKPVDWSDIFRMFK